MKIAHICAVEFTAKKFLVPLCETLSGNGFDVKIFCRVDTKKDKISNLIEHWPFKRQRTVTSILSNIYYSWKFLKNNNYDVIHLHTPFIGYTFRFVLFFIKVKPIIIYTAHGFYFHENMFFLKKIIFSRIEKFLFLKTDYFLSQSIEDYNYAIQNKFIPAEKAICIGNGVDIQRFQFRIDVRNKIRDNYKIRADTPVLITVMRLNQEKGFLVLSDAIRDFDRVFKSGFYFFVILAPDPDSSDDSLFKVVEKLDLKNNIKILWSVDRVEDFLCASDVFILPSLREGLSRSVAEALVNGCLVSGSKIRGIRDYCDLVDDSSSVRLFQPGSSSDLVKTLFTIKLSEIQVEEKRRRSRENCVRLDEEIVFAKHEELYEFIRR